MAEISFRVKTDWQEVDKLIREIDSLNKTISSVNTDLPRAEIEKLTSKLTLLKEKYSEIIAFASKANADLSEIFSKKGAFGDVPTKEMAQDIASDMQKVQSSVESAFNSIYEKVSEFKKSVEDALHFTTEINVPDSAAGVISSIAQNVGALNKETERQQIIISEQAAQNNIILQQQQQETSALNSQGVQMQSLVSNASERADIEGEVSDAVDRTSDSLKKQTEEYEKQTEAIQRNKEARSEKTTLPESSVDDVHEQERLSLLREKEKEYIEKVANAPEGSNEKERALSLLQGVREQIDAIVNGETELVNNIKSESDAREATNQAIEKQYAYLDEIIQKQKDGTLSEKDYLDTIEKTNQEIEERNNKIRELTDKQQSVANVETKYDRNYNIINADEIKEAERLYEEYGKQIDEENARVEKLNNTLSVLTNSQTQQAESAKAAVEEVTQTTTKTFSVFERKDELGNSFRVVAKNAEEADEKIQRTKDSLEIYPQILERIKQKADEMRKNAYMTAEGEKLVKDAEKIEKTLNGRTVSKSFANGGQTDTIKKVNELSDIEEKLDGIHEREKEIEADNQRIAEAEEQARKQAEEHANSAMRIRTRLMNAREEMAKLVAEGKRGTPEFQKLADEAGEMRNQMRQASAVMNYYSDNQRHLHSLKTGLQGVAGAASLVTGVYGMFNEDSKKMVEIQTKVQSVLGIVVGLETTYNLVKQESFFRLAAEEVITWAVAKARGVQAVTTTAAAVAQEKLNGAMMKNPYGAILVLLTTLAASIWAVTKALTSETEAEKKAKEERKKALEEAKKQYESWANSAAQTASKQIYSYSRLQDKWNELGKDVEKKEKFVKDNKKAFNELGWAVNSVTDAENLLVNNTDAVVSAIMARAKAAAYGKVLEEQYEKEIRKRIDEEKQAKSVDKGGSVAVIKAGTKVRGGSLRSKAYKNAIAGGYRTEEGDIVDGKWTEKGVRRLRQYGEAYARQLSKNNKKEIQKRREASDKNIKETEDALKKEVKAEQDALAKVKVKPYVTPEKQKNDSGKTAAEREQELRELLDKQKRNEKRAIEDMEMSIREARIKAMDESSEKTIAQIEINHDKEVLAIQRAYEDLKIKRVEAAKQLWEKDEKNKGKNFFESNEYKVALNSPMRRELKLDDEDLKSLQEQERKLIGSLADNSIIDKIKEQYGKGNVDVIARPVIDAAKLVEKGWKDAGEGIATVFSMQRTVLDENGKERQVLLTPILPDGNVLTPKEIDDYIDNVLSGSDILGVDAKGIVIKVGAEGENIDLGGEDLHLLHEKLFNEDVSKQIKKWYDNLTNLEEINRKERLNAADKATKQAISEELDNRIQALNDYAEKYGSLQEQKKAIAAKYDRKIAKATDDIQRALIEKQKQNELSELKFKELQSSLNWENIFNDLNKLSDRALQELKEKLRTALDMKEITPENAKVLSEKILEIDNRLSDNIWTSMIPALKERLRITNLVKRTEEDIAAKRKNVAQASLANQKALADVQNNAKSLTGRTLTKEELSAKNGTDLAKMLGTTGESAKALAAVFDKYKITTIDLTKATEDLTHAQIEGKNANEMLSNFKSKGIFGNMSDIFKSAAEANGDGFMGAAKVMQTNVNSLAQFTDQIGLAGTEFGEGAHEFAEGVNGFMSAIQSLANGDIFGFVSGVVGGFQGFGHLIERIGGFSFNGNNEEETEERDKELVKSQEGLRRSIDRNSELLKQQNGAESFKTLQQMIAQQKEINEAQWQRFDNEMHYHGSHHSNAYYWDGFSQSQISRINNLLAEKGYGANERINSGAWEELHNLSPEAMKDVRSSLTDIWDFITSRGKYGDVYDQLNAYADLAGEVEELEEQLYEKASLLSENSLHDAFLSGLMDMKKSAKDFTDDFSEMLMKAVLNAQIGNELDEELKAWRKKIAKKMVDQKGSLTTSDITELREDYNKIVKEGLNLRDQIARITGYDSTYQQQDAAHGSATSISYDQADSLIGIEMAKQIILEQILKLMRGGGMTIDGISDEGTSNLDQYIVTSITNEKLDIIIGQIDAIKAESVSSLGDLVVLVKDILKNNGVTTDLSQLFSNVSLTNGRNDYINDAIIKKFLGKNAEFYGWKDIQDIYNAATTKYGWGQTIAKELLKGYDLSSYETFLAQLGKEFGSQFDALYGVTHAETNSGLDTAVEISLLTARAENILSVASQSRDIAADSRDILAGMAIHVEEIRDGVVDTIVPRIKNIDDNLNKVYKIVENQ